MRSNTRNLYLLSLNTFLNILRFSKDGRFISSTQAWYPTSTRYFLNFISRPNTFSAIFIPLFFHRDYYVRANRRAEGASNAACGVDLFHNEVPLIVAHGRGHAQNLLGTRRDTKTATFAGFFVDCEFCHKNLFARHMVSAGETTPPARRHAAHHSSRKITMRNSCN